MFFESSFQVRSGPFIKPCQFFCGLKNVDVVHILSVHLEVIMFSTFVLHIDLRRAKGMQIFGLLCELRSHQPDEAERKRAIKKLSKGELSFSLIASVAGLGVEPSL